MTGSTGETLGLSLQSLLRRISQISVQQQLTKQEFGLFFQFLFFLPKGLPLRTIPRILLLKISKDGDSTTSLGNLFQQRHRCVTNTVSAATLEHRTCFSSQRSCGLNTSVAQLWLCR